MPACVSEEICKPIGQAVIGTSLNVGCRVCPVPPIFSPTARYSSNPGQVSKYRDKLRNQGLITY